MPNDKNSQNNKSTPLGLDPVQQGSSPSLPNQPADTSQTETAPPQPTSTAQTDPVSLQPSPIINNAENPNTTDAAAPALGLEVASPPVAAVPPPPTTPQTPSGEDGKSKKSKPKGKSKKVIAAVLGVLVLVGGIAAGSTLVKQQQDIREKAASLRGPTGICTSNGCNLGDDYSKECYINHWWCARIDNTGNSCHDELIARAVKRATFKKSCGTEQIDVYCPGTTDLNKNFVSRINDNPCYQKVCNGRRCEREIGLESNQCTNDTDCGARTPPPTPTPTPPTGGQCIELLAFDAQGNQLTPQDLSLLSVGDSFILAVRGSSSQGQITKARFSVNGQQKPEITAKQNIGGTEYFVDTYTIPEGLIEFSIDGQVFHPDLGWL